MLRSFINKPSFPVWAGMFFGLIVSVVLFAYPRKPLAPPINATIVPRYSPIATPLAATPIPPNGHFQITPMPPLPFTIDDSHVIHMAPPQPPMITVTRNGERVGAIRVAKGSLNCLVYDGRRVTRVVFQDGHYMTVRCQ